MRKKLFPGVLCLAAVLALGLSGARAAALMAAGAQACTWAGADGAKTFEGELKSYDPDKGMVGVTMANGKEMSFSQDKLSVADITFLKEQGETDAPPTGKLFGAVIPVTDANLLKGLSPYNWVCKADSISSTVNGASITLNFKGTKQVSVQVATDNLATKVPARFPIIAWSVNGGAVQSRQLAAGESAISISAGVADPKIELYLKGMSPFEDRFASDVPANSLKITGFAVDQGGSIMPPELPAKVWLNIGDSIMSGDGAALKKDQGRPQNDLWAASEDGRASYGYLLAQHYGYREARIAYGGYNWGGGMAGVPALVSLIDQRTSTMSRLKDAKLSPSPDVVLVNLGENGAPPDTMVSEALVKLRSRVDIGTTILVMIPISGRARAEVTRGFNRYKDSTKDHNAHLIDLGQVAFDTCDGQHPTAAGHEAVFKAALPVIDKLKLNLQNPKS